MTRADLAGLRPLVQDARVVALGGAPRGAPPPLGPAAGGGARGAAAHNVTELHELRDQVFRTLVELGFTALVLESGFAEGLAVDAWVQGGAGSVEVVAGDAITYGFGHSAAVHSQLTWMRAHGGLRFYGMDVAGSSTSPGPAVRELLARVEPMPGDPGLLARSDLGGRVEAAVRYAGLTDGARSRLHRDLRALAARGWATVDPVAHRLAASVLAFADHQDRDAFMAQTVQWILEREERVLVGAHNGHVQRTPYDGQPTLGSLLSASLGAGLVVVGTSYESGPRVQITDRSERPFDWSVSRAEDGPSPAPSPEDAFDHVLALGRVHPVPGAFDRLRTELAAPYPPTRTVDVVATPAGVAVPDPYRWLEAEDDEVHAWQRRQGEVATGTILGGQDRAALQALVEQYDAGARPVLPRHAAGRWVRPVGDALVVADEPLGDGRTVAVLDPGEVLSWFAPSPDGRLLAFGVCDDGSEHNTVRLVQMASGERLPAPPQVLHSAWAGGVSWQADSGGFWFFALTGTPEEFAQATFHHELATGRTVMEDVPVPEGSREYTLVQASADGRWLVAAHRVGSPIPVAVRDLREPGGPWRPFVTRATGTIAGHVVGDHYVAVTDIGAARGRVVAIPLSSTTPDDPATWTELVAEGPTVLRSLTPVGEHLYLAELDQTHARLRVLAADGRPVGAVPLPAHGTIGAPFFALTGLAGGAPAPELVFAFSTLTRSWSVHRHRPGADVVEELQAPAVTLAATVEAGAAVAGDGTAVPFHVVRPARPPLGATTGEPSPVLVTAYGAANVATLPSYQPDLAAFVAAGGTLVQAYLRGGGELGRDWYLAAHRETKHVRDDDLVAVAEHLVAAGVAAPDRMALTGGSDGGLMCGVAVTTRPDLWRAVLPRAPLLDLVAGMRDPYLDFVIRKAWGDPDDPDDVRRMVGRSPYELVRPGEFPAVYLQAGANDPRCRPWHARKFAARLQAAQRGTAPILVHVFEGAGHGAASAPEVITAQDVEWLGFLVRELGLRLRPSG